ncbi:MAG: hypothetical protein AUK64_2010, partial [bacterium P201]
MKKILSVLLAVLMVSVAFAQGSFRTLGAGNGNQVPALVKARTQQSVHHAVRAAKTTYNVTAVSFQKQYYDSDGDWYCRLQDADDNAFTFDIYTTTLVSGQTYTFDEMDDYYSYALVNGEAYDYTAATFTYTQNADGSETVNATATLDNGDVYVISYYYMAPSMDDATDTIAINIPAAALIDLTATSTGAFQMRGYTVDSAYYASVTPYSTQIPGNYTISDFYADYTVVYESANDVDISIVAGHASVTATATGYAMDAYLLGQDMHCYHVTMTYTTPVAADTVDLVVPAATFNDYSGYDGSYQFIGTTADEASQVSVNYFSETVIGSFTMADCDASYTGIVYNGESKTTYDGNFTVAATDAGYEIDGHILCTDNVCYHFTMYYTIPVATDTIDVLVPTAMLVTEPGDGWFTATSQNWTGTSSDNAYTVALSYSGEEIVGSFVANNLQSNSNINNINFVEGHFEVAATDGGYALESHLIGSDLHCYHITMTYTIPTMDDATDTIAVNIPAAMLTDLTADNGVFQMRGYTVDSATYASVAVYSSQIPGNYEFEDFYGQYTTVYDVLLGNQINVVAGHATVSATAVGYSLDAYLLGADLHCYHVTMTYSTPVAADTVEVVIPSATFSDYSDYDGSYQFIGASEDETYEVGFNYFSSTITGSFTWADCDASYSGLYVNGTSLSVYSAEFTVTEVEGGYQVEAYVLCTDNHCYHVMMFYSAEGINTANQVQVKVYPNPAADMLHVEADGIVRIDVIDAAGRIVLSNTRNVNTLNISGLSNGVY